MKNNEEKENKMTNEQEQSIREQLREQVGEGFEVATVACETLVELIEEKPELVEGIGKLLVKYWTVFRPMLQEVNEDVINLRVNQYEQIKALLPHLNDDQLIKLITSC